MGRTAVANHDLNSKIFRQVRGSAPLEPQVKGLQVPARIVWGEKARALNVGGARILAGLMPNASVLILPGVGHLPMLERPREVGQDYRAFRDGLAGHPYGFGNRGCQAGRERLELQGNRQDSPQVVFHDRSSTQEHPAEDRSFEHLRLGQPACTDRLAAGLRSRGSGAGESRIGDGGSEIRRLTKSSIRRCRPMKPGFIDPDRYREPSR